MIIAIIFLFIALFGILVVLYKLPYIRRQSSTSYLMTLVFSIALLVIALGMIKNSMPDDIAIGKAHYVENAQTIIIDVSNDYPDSLIVRDITKLLNRIK